MLRATLEVQVSQSRFLLCSFVAFCICDFSRPSSGFYMVYSALRAFLFLLMRTPRFVCCSYCIHSGHSLHSVLTASLAFSHRARSAFSFCVVPTLRVAATVRFHRAAVPSLVPTRPPAFQTSFPHSFPCTVHVYLLPAADLDLACLCSYRRVVFTWPQVSYKLQCSIYTNLMLQVPHRVILFFGSGVTLS